MTTCIENLGVCKASCCRLLTFDLPICIGHPLEDYYRKRGLKVIRINRGMIKVLVPHVCGALDTETNLCKLHESGKKPGVCKSLNADTAKDGRYYITEGCIHKK